MISPALSVTYQVEHVLQWIDVTFLKICRGIGERRYVKYCILCAYESPVSTEIFIKPKKKFGSTAMFIFILCSRLGIYRTDEHACLLIPWQPHIQLWKPHHIRILSIECLSCSSAYWNIYQTKDKYCSTNMFIFYSVRTTMTNMTRTEIHVCWLHGNHTRSCESNATTAAPPLVHSWQPNTRLMGVLWNPFVIHWGCYYHHVNIKCVCNKLTRHSCVTYI